MSTSREGVGKDGPSLSRLLGCQPGSERYNSRMQATPGDKLQTYLESWTDREELADRFVPITGALYSKHGVVATVYGISLVHKNPIEIIKAHRYTRKLHGKVLPLAQSLAMLELLQQLSLAPARINLGALFFGYQPDNHGSLEAYVRNELKDLINRPKPMRAKPQDVVLYGFGRIGRLMARILIDKTGGGDKFRLRAIVTRPGKPEDLHKRASLLRRDSVHGPFMGSITVDEDAHALVINGNLVHIIEASAPEQADYATHGIDDAIVIDNTGRWRDREGLGKHLQAKGVDRVILTAPGKGDIPNIVYGVNHETLAATEKIVSAASCTTNAIVPVLKAVHDRYGIASGHLETIHAYTNDQNLIDNFHPKARRGRGAPLNMVITETGAAKAVAKALPELAGKLTGNAIRVPTPNVSLAVLNLQLDADITTADLNDFLREVSMDSALHYQIDYTMSPDVVSSDLVGNRHACIVDATATIVHGRRCTLYAWYDNEYGYSCQVMRLLQEMSGVVPPRYPRSPNF